MQFAFASLHFDWEAQEKAASSSISEDLGKSCSRLGAAYDCVVNVAEAPRLFNIFFKNYSPGILHFKKQYEMNFAFASLHFAWGFTKKQRRAASARTSGYIPFA